MVLTRLRSNRSERGLRPNTAQETSVTSAYNNEKTSLRANKSSTHLTPHSAALSYDGRRSPLAREEPLSSAPRESHGRSAQDATTNQRRFSLLRVRRASDSQLSTSAKQQDPIPPVPPIPTRADAPAITMTVPTVRLEAGSPERRKSLFRSFRWRKPPVDAESLKPPSPRPSRDNIIQPSCEVPASGSVRNSPSNFDEPGRLSLSHKQSVPASIGNEENFLLHLPHSSHSDSPMSERSSADRTSFVTNTTQDSISPAMALFQLPRRKRKAASLFPLPVKIPPPEQFVPSISAGAVPTHGRTEVSPKRSPTAQTASQTMLRRAVARRKTENDIPLTLITAPSSALASGSLSFAAPAVPLFRADSIVSARSARSTPIISSTTPQTMRGRSSTLGSTQSYRDDTTPPTPPPQSSSRTSFSTLGKRGLNSLAAGFRKNSEQFPPRHESPIGPGTSTSNLANMIVPERHEGETAGRYLERMQEQLERRYIGALMSRSADEFSKSVLRSFMRTFAFFQEPLDMSMRKLTMTAELPKETQQIQRMVEGFADRYHECNPGIFLSSDQVFLVSYATLMLHTDIHNRNVKRRNMQKPDFLNMLKENEIAEEVLSCMYDNIAYTPFIRVDEDDDILAKNNSHKSRAQKALAKAGTPPDLIKKTSKHPVDPYILILESNLDSLRPNVKDMLHADEDPYNYIGTAQRLDHEGLRSAFARSGILSILSARSRPEAFKLSGPTQAVGLDEGPPGLQKIRIAKAGLLWRKDPKKKDKPRGPWREWGALLTISQLLLFKDPSLAKSLLHQNKAHAKEDDRKGPVVYKPPLEEFKPDYVVSIENAIALLDATYKKHKNAFVLHRHSVNEVHDEVFLADDSAEMNDWIATINYAAAFRTARLAMQDTVDQGSHVVLNGASPCNDSSPLEHQIAAARSPKLRANIAERNKRLVHARKQLAPHLRNARHLQILAPIQARTREEVINGAGRLCTKLQWWRMELCRNRCYKMILMTDLGEQSTGLTDSENEDVPDVSADLDTGAERRPAVDSLIASNDAEAGQARFPLLLRADSEDSQFGAAEAFKTPPEYVQQMGDASVQEVSQSTKLPVEIKTVVQRSRVPKSPSSPRSDRMRQQLASTGTSWSSKAPSAAEPVFRAENPTMDVPDLEGEHGLNISESRSHEKRTQTVSEEFGSTPSNATPSRRSKVRLSFHRKGLRDSPSSNHHRGRKGKESMSSVATNHSSGQESEGLARAKPRFTLHGKKASVIQFGIDWEKLSAEERFKIQEEAQDDDGRGAVVDDDESSVSPSAGGVSRASSKENVAAAGDKGLRTFYLQHPSEDDTESPSHEEYEEYQEEAESGPVARGGLSRQLSFFEQRTPYEVPERKVESTLGFHRFDDDRSLVYDDRRGHRRRSPVVRA